MEKKKATPVNSDLGPPAMFLVRMRGLEPPRCHHHRLLRPARLPVPPHPQKWRGHYANEVLQCQMALLNSGATGDLPFGIESCRKAYTGCWASKNGPNLRAVEAPGYPSVRHARHDN